MVRTLIIDESQLTAAQIDVIRKVFGKSALSSTTEELEKEFQNVVPKDSFSMFRTFDVTYKSGKKTVATVRASIKPTSDGYVVVFGISVKSDDEFDNNPLVGHVIACKRNLTASEMFKTSEKFKFTEDRKGIVIPISLTAFELIEKKMFSIACVLEKKGANLFFETCV